MIKNKLLSIKGIKHIKSMIKNYFDVKLRISLGKYSYADSMAINYDYNFNPVALQATNFSYNFINNIT